MLKVQKKAENKGVAFSALKVGDLFRLHPNSSNPDILMKIKGVNSLEFKAGKTPAEVVNLEKGVLYSSPLAEEVFPLNATLIEE